MEPEKEGRLKKGLMKVFAAAVLLTGSGCVGFGLTWATDSIRWKFEDDNTAQADACYDKWPDCSDRGKAKLEEQRQKDMTGVLGFGLAVAGGLVLARARRE